MKNRTCENNITYWATPQEDREYCQIQVQRKESKIQVQQGSIRENRQGKQTVNSKVIS